MTLATIPALLSARARANPAKIFLYFRDLEVSYQKLDEITNRLAQGLAALGLRVGDKLCVMLPNCPEYVYLFLGASKLAVTLVPINIALKHDEICYIADNSDAVAIVAAGPLLGLAAAIKNSSQKLRYLIALDPPSESVLPEALSFAQLLNASADPIDHSTPTTVVAIMYTSGTTGKPKGVMLTQDNYIN
ncbi:MAG: AMP-binding protein, partial [Acidobacteriota bacterium]